MNRLAPMMSSTKSDWRTPRAVLDLVRNVAPIGLDPATTIDNPTMAHSICVAPGTEIPPDLIIGGEPAAGGFVHLDGLSGIDWAAAAKHHGGLCFVNPPYSRTVGLWVTRCAEAGRNGGKVIALLPARTDTTWWQGYCVPPESAAVCFWRGRLTFEGAPAPAPFPSAFVYFGPRPHRFADVFAPHGRIWM